VTRAHFSRKATDDQGNIVPGTTVTVYSPGSLAPLQNTLYVNEVGSVTLNNPFTINDGLIDFYLDSPGQVKVGLQAPNGTERFYDNQDVYPDPQTVVSAPEGLQITNIPQPGDFLQATAPRQATWVTSPDLQTAALTPVHILLQQGFSGENIGDLVLKNASNQVAVPGFVDVTADTKPPGFTFTRALDWDTSQKMTLTAPTELFVESGQVQFLYKIIEPAAGKTSPILRVTLDDATSLWVQTPAWTEEYDVWQVGYLTNIPPGAHIVRIQHLPGNDPASRVLLGLVVAQYGGMVPPHAHEGAGLLSTQIGTGASANFTGATALGGEASAAGVSGTAVGAQAVAQASATAVGASTTAVQNGVAVGYQARTSPAASGGVAIGSGAAVQGSGSVAAGPAALVMGARGVAIGSTALAGEEAIAVGASSVASAARAVAIGVGASAGHPGSVALGPHAQTTAANQVVLGTSEATVVVPGALRQTGDAVLGSTGSTIGFFGEPGTTRPVVTGSRGGNAVLGTLITYLETLGLIQDDTTA
jgi:hypothetical protein